MQGVDPRRRSGLTAFWRRRDSEDGRRRTDLLAVGRGFRQPDKYECGSLNLPGIAGLSTALDWIRDQTVEELARRERRLVELFLDSVEGTDGVEGLGPARREDLERRVGILSVRLRGHEPLHVSAELERRFGILTRSGVHSAPAAHRTMGTLGRAGSTRLSFGAFTTEKEVLDAAAALRALAVEPPPGGRFAPCPATLSVT